jgi:hypothetical protein
MYEEIEDIIPEEFEKFANQSKEDRENSKPYYSSLHNKLRFMSVDIGDVIAFDLFARVNLLLFTGNMKQKK